MAQRLRLLFFSSDEEDSPRIAQIFKKAVDIERKSNSTIHPNLHVVRWIKIKNPAYSQAEGRHEMFER
jgi:hypothetical protein